MQLANSDQVVTSVKDVSDGEALKITVADGSVQAVAGPGNAGDSSSPNDKPVVGKRKIKAKTAAKSGQDRGMAPLF